MFSLEYCLVNFGHVLIGHMYIHGIEIEMD